MAEKLLSKKMKKKFHRRTPKGQMLMEFCIMLVIAVLLVYALLALFDILSENGDRMVDMVGHTVP
jgi:hypothetical protein